MSNACDSLLDRSSQYCTSTEHNTSVLVSIVSAGWSNSPPVSIPRSGTVLHCTVEDALFSASFSATIL